MQASTRKNKPQSPTAELLDEMLQRHPSILQTDLAKSAGLGSAGNIISLFKKGRTKLPIKHIPKLCETLGEDPSELIESALREYQPEMLEAMSLLNGEAFDENEKELLKIYRSAARARRKEVSQERQSHARSNAIQEGNLLKEIDLRTIKRVSLRLTNDPIERAALSKMIKDNLIENLQGASDDI